MIRTLYYFPTEAEASVFRTLRPDADVRIIGVGAAAAGAVAAKWIATLEPERVVLCGIAGACDDRLVIGEVVEVESDALAGLPEAYAERYASRTTGMLPKVNTLTVNHSSDALSYIPEDATLPYIEQMEGAGVAAVCDVLGIREFYHIRAISNRVGDDRSKWRIEDAIEALGSVVSRMFNE